MKTEQHSLVTNGLDFLESSVEQLTDKKNGKIKYAVLHLFSGTLLILKERIRHEHWSLLFQKAELASLQKYESGDFEGITFDRIIHVLKEVAQLKVSAEDEKALNDIRKIRNKVEHFEYSISIEQFRPLAGRVLNFAIRFIEVNLQETALGDDDQEIFSDLKGTARGFQEYVDERLKVVAKYSADNGYDLFYCVECLERSLVKEPEDFKCLVCGLEGVDTDAVVESHFINALDIYHDPTDGSDLPQYNCPECGENTLVPEDKSFRKFLCVNCSARANARNLHTCNDCSVVFHSSADEPMSICGDCMRYRFERD